MKKPNSTGSTATTVKAWADGLPAGAWHRFTLRDGEKGPLPVRAAQARVLTAREDGTQRVEVLVVVDSLTSSKCWWYLATDTQAGLAELLPSLRVVGGCCGTDARHVAAMWGVTTP